MEKLNGRKEKMIRSFIAVSGLNRHRPNESLYSRLYFIGFLKIIVITPGQVLFVAIRKNAVIEYLTHLILVFNPQIKIKKNKNHLTFLFIKCNNFRQLIAFNDKSGGFKRWKRKKGKGEYFKELNIPLQ
ncbi:MAG: hypothetical protein ACM3SY_15850 [Candidatus Omnitrophota bacterium]